MTTTLDIDDLRDGLVSAGYEPTHAFGDIFTTSKTVRYFEARGWDAVRVLSDSMQFARFSDEGLELLSTTYSGVINTQASFTTDPHGIRMFLVSAELRP